MINQTKQILEESLKKLMLQKPLDKITIRDLTEDCDISRMAFYYHFKDIYDPVEWSCLEDATRALAGKKTYDTWSEGLVQIFDAVYENKPFILNAYRCISRDQIESFLFHLTSDLLMNVVEEKAEGTSISEEDRRFIADFYKYSFVGLMLDWIEQGMKDDYVDRHIRSVLPSTEALRIQLKISQHFLKKKIHNTNILNLFFYKKRQMISFLSLLALL